MCFQFGICIQLEREKTIGVIYINGWERKVKWERGCAVYDLFFFV